MAVASRILIISLLVGFCSHAVLGRPRLTKEEDIFEQITSFVKLRRVSRAVDFATCELDITDAAEPYDEECENGATGLMPCNPGQLKVKECITTSDDLFRICDPCPQKFFQSTYNRCTLCHPCSECGPNERISQDCTDETDTVCENIVPDPPAAPTTTVPSLGTSTPAVPTPRPIDPTQQTTPGDDATLVTTVRPDTTQPEVPPIVTFEATTEPVTNASIGVGLQSSPNSNAYVIPLVVLFCVVPWFLFVWLAVKYKVLKKKYCKLKSDAIDMYDLLQESQGNRQLLQRDEEANNSLLSAEPEDQNVVPCKEPDNPVIDRPDDELDPIANGEHRISRGFAVDVVKDAHRVDDGNPEEDHQDEATQEINSFEVEAEVNQLCEKIPASSDSSPYADGADGGDNHNPPAGSQENSQEGEQTTPKQDSRSMSECHSNLSPEEVPVSDGPPSHNSEQLSHIPNAEEPLIKKHDSPPSDRDSQSRKRPRTSGSRSNTTGDNCPTVKKPASDHSLPGTSQQPSVTRDIPLGHPTGDAPSRNNPKASNGSSGGSDRHQKRAPRQESRGQQIQPDHPKAPRSGNRKKRPSEQRPLPTVTESENHTASANKRATPLQFIAPPPTQKSQQPAPLASIDLQGEDPHRGNSRISKVNNNTRDLHVGYASGDPQENGPDAENSTMSPVQVNGESDLSYQSPSGTGSFISNLLPFSFGKRKKRKKYNPVSSESGQEEDFLASRSDKMVSEMFLDYVASVIALSTLDKMCRAIGAEQNEIDNLRETFKDYRGSEHAFKVLRGLLGRLGKKFTYARTIQALKESNKRDVISKIVEKYTNSENNESSV